jgi:hypothetical protein
VANSKVKVLVTPEIPIFSYLGEDVPAMMTSRGGGAKKKPHAATPSSREYILHAFLARGSSHAAASNEDMTVKEERSGSDSRVLRHQEENSLSRTVRFVFFTFPVRFTVLFQ